MIPLILTATVATASAALAHPKVWIETSPPGAEVYLDGRPAGRAPIEVELAPEVRVVGAVLGTATGAHIFRDGNDAAPARLSIVLSEPGGSAAVVEAPWRPSWRGALLGASMIGAGAFVHTRERDPPTFVSFGLILSGAFVSALAIGIGE